MVLNHLISFLKIFFAQLLSRRLQSIKVLSNGGKLEYCDLILLESLVLVVEVGKHGLNSEGDSDNCVRFTDIHGLSNVCWSGKSTLFLGGSVRDQVGNVHTHPTVQVSKLAHAEPAISLCHTNTDNTSFDTPGIQ